MNIGMLWFDNDPSKSFDDKILSAKNYYQEKYEQIPNLCFVHTSMNHEFKVIHEVEIRATKDMLPNHFWIGFDDSEKSIGMKYEPQYS